MEDIRKGTCPLCQHNEIIAAFATDLAPDGHGTGAFAASITHTMRGGQRFQSHGVIIRYVCRRCGFIQSFAEAPSMIPIDPAHRTSLIKGPEPQGPYR
jgi:hypothetical protein